MTYWKRPWCWERLMAGEGDNRGWDGWMVSLTWWTWVWANSGSWWLTGRPGVLQSMGSQRVGHDWVTELSWLLRFSKPPPAHCCQRFWSRWSCFSFTTTHWGNCSLPPLYRQTRAHGHKRFTRRHTACSQRQLPNSVRCCFNTILQTQARMAILNVGT